jgi:two-component system, NarL family, sensor kinase
MEVQSEIIRVFVYTFLAFISMATVLVLFFYFSRKKIIKHEIEKKNLEITYQKEILNAVILTQEKERKRIAQDLHDEISSKINVVSLNSHLLRTPNLNEQEINEITNNIALLAASALESSRRIAHDLFPPVFEKFGLEAGIEELVAEYKSTGQLEIEFINQISLGELNKDIQLGLFRIIQELLHNTLKHAKAKKCTISFSMENETFCLLYLDNGVGFVISDEKKGMGLINIDSRIGLLNGHYKINTSPNNGFEIKIVF